MESMKKIIVFGAGNFGRRYILSCNNDVQVLAVADNDEDLRGKTLFGHRIIAPSELPAHDFDLVVIALDDRMEEKTTGRGVKNILAVYDQLRSAGIRDEQILLQNMEYSRQDARVVFLRELAESQREAGISGAVAECGVYRGYFASYMNEYYPERMLYLFDSFMGFRESGIASENEWVKTEGQDWTQGNERLAVLRCPHRGRVAVKRGWAPETFAGCEDERFAFVNLDMDLYEPQLAALRFFAPRLARGGVILLHDYYFPNLPGVKQAADEFAKERSFVRVPIGDGLSVALIFTEG
jgi:hypothetical protein